MAQTAAVEIRRQSDLLQTQGACHQARLPLGAPPLRAAPGAI